MRKKSTRFLSAALAACMMLSALPVGAFAAAPAAASTESAVSTQAEEEFVQPESVEINETNFQYTDFRNYVKKFDLDGDNSLSLEERNKVTKIELPEDLYCPTMKGIEYFPELVTLKCDQDRVRSLDVSKNLKLETLWCIWNSLDQLDVSKNKALKDLRCGYNNLTTLNVSQNEALEHLSTNDMRSKLNSLDVSCNKALKHLECSKNGLTSLDVSSNEALEYLVCNNNPLTELDVSKNNKLKSLYCRKCGLTSLKVGPAVRSMDCSENLLTELDVSQNTEWTSLRCNDNKLTSLKLNENAFSGSYVTEIVSSNNHYPIAVDADGIYDLSQLPGGFEVSKTSDWTNGEQTGTTLKVTPGSTTVTYKYDTGNTHISLRTFNLDVHWHNYQWRHNGTEHWKECTTANCPADQTAKGPHTFASAKDAACADGCGYTRPLYTVTVKNATAILGGEELNAPVAAGTKVTLTADTTPEDKELHGWKLYKVAADGTETEITDTTGLLSGSVRVVTLTVPDYNVKAVPDYADILYDVNAVKCTVTLNNVEVPAAAKGDVITATPNEQGPGKKFTGWTVTKTVNGVEVDITDELRDVSQNGLIIAELTMPAADVTIEALFDDDSQLPEPDPDQPVVTDDGSGDIVAGVVIGGIAAVGAYEVGTGLYRITQMDDVAMPTNRLALAKLLWERAGKPEPESTALYSDISAEDTDAQKAARWAVEQELLKDDTNEDEQKFHPAFPVSKLRVCLTWEKAKQKGLFDTAAE